jgi:uncharacterized protein (TIGR00369 family)
MLMASVMAHESPRPSPAEVEATVDRWLAREREMRLILAAPGRIPLSELPRYSGMELLERMGRGEFPSVPIAQTLDFVPVEWESGRMVFQGTPRAEFYNPIGSVHGGYIATLLDSALACAVHTKVPRGYGYTTLELKVNFLRALTDKTGPVRAEGRIISVGRQVGTADGRLLTPLDVCMRMPPPPVSSFRFQT